MTTMPDITLAIETISPSVAADMLRHNTRNRPIRTSVVNAYIRSMTAGDWTFTGESISFTENGRLVNGQHRLTAVVKSGCSISAVVVRGVPDSAWGHTDAGSKRSTADMLQHAGHANATQLAATAALVLKVEGNNVAANTQPSRDEIQREIERRAVTYDAALTWARRARAIGLPPGAASAFYALMEARGMALDADAWLAGLIEGVGLSLGDSRLAVRNWLVNSRRQPSAQCLAVLIFAWNAHVANRNVKAMRPWRRGEPFPSITSTT